MVVNERAQDSGKGAGDGFSTMVVNDEAEGGNSNMWSTMVVNEKAEAPEAEGSGDIWSTMVVNDVAEQQEQKGIEKWGSTTGMPNKPLLWSVTVPSDARAARRANMHPCLSTPLRVLQGRIYDRVPYSPPRPFSYLAEPRTW